MIGEEDADRKIDIYIAFGKDSEYYGKVGEAWVGGACKPYLKTSMNEWRRTPVETAMLVSHEVGHNFGMSHDFDEKHGGKNNPRCDNKGIMSYGDVPVAWSDCSVSDFTGHYNSEEWGETCLKNWGPYCGDKCPGFGPCTITPNNLCEMVDTYGGCNGRHKSLFEKGCQKTCGFCKVQDSTGFKKISQKHCFDSKYGSYPTESAAKTACAADSNCKGVYDISCDNKNPFHLCPLSATYAPSQSSCILEKTTLGNEFGCQPKDSNTCLQTSPDWIGGWEWWKTHTCSNSIDHCTDWAKDMRRCCPESCGTGTFTEHDCRMTPGEGDCLYPNEAQCSASLDERSATIACQNFGSGWSVDKILSKALVCTKSGTSWNDNCNDCTTWRMIVWQDGGCENDSKCQQYSVSTVAGKYYGAHSPCVWGDNYQECGVWGRTD